MQYLVIFLVLFGLMMILSVNNIYAMPPFHSQEIYDFSNVIVVGKVISVNSTFSPTHNLYEIQVEKFLKNPQDLDVLFAAGQKTANIRLGNQVFDVNDRGLFYLINNTIGYDPYFGIFGVYPTSQLIEPEWDKCNIFEKEITREHWFLGGGGITPKIQQGTNSDIENFNKDKPVTVTYDVSNLSDSVQEFDLDGTLVSHVTASKVMATMNQHIILEPCTIYKTIDWEFTPSMTGFYNFEIKDSRSGSYGLGFTVVDNDSTVIKSPLKQIKSGVALVDVQCSDEKVPAVRYDRMRVACVSLDTEGKLVMRGWATMRLAMPGDNISEALCNNYEGKWHPEYNGCRSISDLQCSLIGGKFVDDLKICEDGICPEKRYAICVVEPKKLDWKMINSEFPMMPSVFQVSKDTKMFDVEYGINGGMIKNMTFSNQTNSILVEIDSVDKGNLTLGIPRNLLDAKMDYCPPRLTNPPDDRFFVILDGEEIWYNEILTTNEIRVLQLKFAENSSKLEIIASCLI